MDDAIKFILEVKETLHQTNDIDSNYNLFAFALKLFELGRISSDDLVQTLEHLFEGHQNLIIGLKKFTSENHETRRAPNSCTKEKDFGLKSEGAASKEFLTNVKERFKDNIRVYEEFLNVVINYRRGGLTMRRVSEKIFSLFFGHADLFCQFEQFWDDDHEQVRKQMGSIRLSLIEDHLFKMDVLIGNLQSAILSTKKVIMDGCVSEQDKLTDSIRCSEKLYGEVMEFLPEVLRANPTRHFGLRSSRVHHPMKHSGLQALMEKEEELCQIRSKYIEFLKECHEIRCRIQ